MQIQLPLAANQIIHPLRQSKIFSKVIVTSRAVERPMSAFYRAFICTLLVSVMLCSTSNVHGGAYPEIPEDEFPDDFEFSDDTRPPMGHYKRAQFLRLGKRPHYMVPSRRASFLRLGK
ncbi:hypothetical protein CSKR_203090 [Clonorchis sinensis]|uniref:Uncharacterized protein n=1 Tax=Clonorchis sinensis TaxID=79923 RepID=A0A8T1M6N8_CLOSI|nr:hypothetical protein CSKR_203090 [Clonorchis sinensis]